MTPSRRRRPAALLLVVACLLGLFAGSGVAGAQQRRVVVVGDSIILGAQGPLTSAFTNQGWAVTYDAAVSRSTAAGLDAVESHRAELTDSLVVSLGANDAGSPAAFRQRVQAILDATATVPHVYWVTIREVRDYYGPANQIVREVAAGRPNVTVIDWHAATAGTTDLTSSDGLHLNGAGAARMAQVVTDAVVAGSLPAAAAPTTTAPPPPTTAPPTTAAPPTTVATTLAPTTTGATTTAAPTTTVERDRTQADAREVEDSTILDADTIWTVGGGFGVVVVLMALCGVALAGWALVRSRPGSAPPRSPAHPAVRARQRAERIAAAAAEAPGGTEEPSPVVASDTQQS
jgi:lysophospholipase L1-like esterase